MWGSDPGVAGHPSRSDTTSFLLVHIYKYIYIFLPLLISHETIFILLIFFLLNKVRTCTARFLLAILLRAPKTLEQFTLASVHVNGEKLYSLARAGNGRFSFSYWVVLNPKMEGSFSGDH